MLTADLSTVITFNPSKIAAETTLDELVEMLADAGFHHWPVVDDEHRPLGVVSFADIVRVIEERAAAREIAGQRPSRLPACVAEEFMSRHVVTIEHDESPLTALRLLREHDLHSLLVVENERLIGIVTTTDFLREFSYGAFPGYKELVSKHLRRVEETLDVTATLDEAAEFFLEFGEYAGVLHGGCPLGVISRRDVLKARCRQTARKLLGVRYGCGPLTVHDLVADSPLIRPGETLGAAANKMVDAQRLAVGVVTQGNRLMGILTDEELLRVMAGGRDEDAMVAGSAWRAGR